jgi:hypothetical protein
MMMQYVFLTSIFHNQYKASIPSHFYYFSDFLNFLLHKKEQRRCAFALKELEKIEFSFFRYKRWTAN